MATLAQLVVKISGDTGAIEAALGRVEKKADSTAGGIGKAFSSIGKFTAVGAAAGLAALTAAAVSFTGEAREAVKIEKQLDAVLKSTAGVAGVTAAAAIKYADAMQRVTNFDDEAVLSAENVLLTFTKIGKQAFEPAIEAALNMSTALGTDLQSAVVMVGKALNDPVKGMTAMTKAGIQFTEQQKSQIEALVESGDLLGAQKVILKELETQFGGSARAAADPWIQVKNQFGELQEVLGKALLPTVTRLSAAFRDFIIAHQPQIDAFAAALAEKLPAAIDKLAAGAAKAFDVISPLLDSMDATDVLIIAGAIGGVLVAAVVAYTAATVAAMIATVGLTGGLLIAIPAIIAAVVLLVRNWDAVWAGMQAAPAAILDWLQSHWKNVLLGASGPIGWVILLGKHWDDVWAKMPAPVQAAMNFVASIFEVAINKIIAGVNKLIDGFNKVGGLGKKIGLDFSLEHIDDVDLQNSGRKGGGEHALGRFADGQFTRGAKEAAAAIDGLTSGLGGEGGGGGGLAGAAKAADMGLQELAAAFDEWHAQTDGAVSTFLALIQVAQDKDALDKRAMQASIGLQAAQMEATDGSFQLRKGLVAMAEKAIEMGGSMPRAIEAALRGVTDNIRNAFGGLFGRPTKEGAELDLQIALLEEKLAREKAAGASEEETKGLQENIERLRTRKDVLDKHANVLKAQIELADKTLITEGQRDFAAQLYTIALGTASTQLDQASALVSLQGIAQANYVNALNSASAAVGGSSDPFSAAEKHWINDVANSRDEPEPFPGFAMGTAFVPRDMLAMLHRGERVVTAAANRRTSESGAGGPVTNITNINVYPQNINLQGDAQAGLASLSEVFGS